MHDQLAEYFEAVFNPFLSAFRKGFGCQATFLRLLENWKRALDNHECVAAILMDLSNLSATRSAQEKLKHMACLLGQ